MKTSSAVALAFGLGLISLACAVDLAYLWIALNSSGAVGDIENVGYIPSGALTVGGVSLVGLLVSLPLAAVFAIIGVVNSRSLRIQH